MNAMNMKSYAGNYQSPLLSKFRFFTNTTLSTPIYLPPPSNAAAGRGNKLTVKVSVDGGEKQAEKRSFLSLEEAGIVEISGLSSHERFLCRLTISSLNLLRVISEQEGCAIEELNSGKVCDWFLKDKLKREQNMESAVLQWDDSQFPL